MRKIMDKLTQEQIKEFFDYKNGKLYWKIKRSIRVSIGDLVGTIVAYQEGHKGYYRTRIGNNFYYCHNLVWKLFHNYYPKKIKFLNGDTLDYSIENIKEYDASEMLFANKKRKDNKSGYKGVLFIKRSGKYIAAISKENKRIYLGTYNTPEEANEAYLKAAREMYPRVFKDKEGLI
jgi:hypothetical protein